MAGCAVKSCVSSVARSENKDEAMGSFDFVFLLITDQWIKKFEEYAYSLEPYGMATASGNPGLARIMHGYEE